MHNPKHLGVVQIMIPLRSSPRGDIHPEIVPDDKIGINFNSCAYAPLAKIKFVLIPESVSRLHRNKCRPPARVYRLCVCLCGVRRCESRQTGNRKDGRKVVGVVYEEK